MYGHLKIMFGNHKWLNYNEQVELLVVLNGHRMVKFLKIKKSMKFVFFVKKINLLLVQVIKMLQYVIMKLNKDFGQQK